MAKIITRTFQVYTVEVMGLNTATNNGEIRNFTIVDADEKRMADEVNEANTDANFIPVKILKTTVSEELYGMDAKKFVANAEHLPPRKQYGADTAE